MDMLSTCETCKFFGTLTKTCHRFPPQIVHTTHRNEYDVLFYQVEQHWPIMRVDDWCGEHKEEAHD